jgi:flagellar protein FliO/FliZ
MYWLALTMLVGGLVCPFQGANAETILQKISTNSSKSEFVTTLKFSAPISKDDLSIEYIGRTVQVNIPDVKMRWKKDLRKVNKQSVSTLYTFQEGATLRTRVNYSKGIDANTFKGHVDLKVDGSKLTVTVKSPEYIAANDKGIATELPAFKPVDLDAEINRAMNMAQEETEQEKLILKVDAEEKVPVAVKAPTKKVSKKKAKKDLKESDIPVLAGKSKKEKPELKSAWSRMIISLIVVALIGGGFVFFGRWWNRTHKRNDLNTKIRVLSQFHIGPKKSLTIVRVAGESLLLGVTDNSISMLKTLSLVDDELPEVVPQEFKESLNTHLDNPDAEAVSEVEEQEDFAMGDIRDVVSNRLKKMRSI